MFTKLLNMTSTIILQGTRYVRAEWLLLLPLITWAVLIAFFGWMFFKSAEQRNEQVTRIVRFMIANKLLHVRLPFLTYFREIDLAVELSIFKKGFWFWRDVVPGLFFLPAALVFLTIVILTNGYEEAMAYLLAMLLAPMPYFIFITYIYFVYKRASEDATNNKSDMNENRN